MSSYNFSENLIKSASMALSKPEDFGYWGPSDMFKTWGFCGIDVDPSSDALIRSNYECMTNELKQRFPNDIRTETYRHWLVGSVTRTVIRVIHNPNEIISENNITDAFRYAMEMKDRINDYPIYDEFHYSEIVHEENVENLEYHSCVHMINKSNPNWKYEIYSHCIENSCSDDITENDFLFAAYELRMWNQDYVQEWFDWADRTGIERPPFDLESISRWNPNQLNLFN